MLLLKLSEYKKTLDNCIPWPKQQLLSHNPQRCQQERISAGGSAIEFCSQNQIYRSKLDSTPTEKLGMRQPKIWIHMLSIFDHSAQREQGYPPEIQEL